MVSASLRVARIAPSVTLSNRSFQSDTKGSGLLPIWRMTVGPFTRARRTDADATGGSHAQSSVSRRPVEIDVRSGGARAQPLAPRHSGDGVGEARTGVPGRMPRVDR